MSKVWFITGAGSGIGAGTAKAALGAGDKVEPGFFRTGLLDPSSVEWSSEHIEDYGPMGNIAAAWSVYNGQQPNDPAALGEALVQIADMEHPPKVVAAGGDALDAITPVVEARLG